MTDVCAYSDFAFEQRKALFSDMLADIAGRTGLKRLHLATILPSGSARILASKGAVRISRQWLLEMPVSCLQAAALHEAGHAWSYEKRVRPQMPTLAAVGLCGLAMPCLYWGTTLVMPMALAGLGMLALAGWVQLSADEGTLGWLEEEVRADLFCVYHQGTDAHLRNALAAVWPTDDPWAQKRISWRLAAVAQAQREGWVSQCVLSPNKPLPLIDAWRDASIYAETAWGRLRLWLQSKGRVRGLVGALARAV